MKRNRLPVIPHAGKSMQPRSEYPTLKIGYFNPDVDVDLYGKIPTVYVNGTTCFEKEKKEVVTLTFYLAPQRPTRKNRILQWFAKNIIKLIK